MSLFPVTSTFALPLTVYYIFLQVRVVAARLKTQTSLATSTADKKKSPTPAGASPDADPLLPAFRTQANFAENVPIVLILAGLVEANGGNKTVLATVLAVVTVARVMHGEMGLMTKGAGGIGRPVGFFSTTAAMLGLAVYGAWISRGHWGF